MKNTPILLLLISTTVFSNENILSMKPLNQCPDSPNCVSSQSHSPSHKISPLPYTSSPDEVIQYIKKVMLTFPRTTFTEEKDNYLHIEFKSLIFRFIDDVEIIIDETEKMIHFRSASRVGHSDLGVNRRRIEKIKIKITQHQQKLP